MVNDDIIQAGRGYEPHPHRNREIITCIRQGAITPRDSEGNEGCTAAGDVQVMSTGTGTTHSECNLESHDTVLFQIWIQRNRENVNPRRDQRAFTGEPVIGELNLLVSNGGGNGLPVHQDGAVYGGRMRSGTTLCHPVAHQACVLQSRGELAIGGHFSSKAMLGKPPMSGESKFRPPLERK